MSDVIAELVELSREIGRADRRMTILAEGNTSVRLDATRFAVKASGANLAALTAEDLTACDTAKVLALLDRKSATDDEVHGALLEARVDAASRKPSIETLFHAWLLTLEGVQFVGHSHPIETNKLLCSPHGRAFAERPIFPDQVVCCGPEAVFVPYADPGLALAREVRQHTLTFMEKNGAPPRLILLQNHGVIALGPTAQSVLACLLMSEKAAEIFAGAAQLGGPAFLAKKHVERIAGRNDEAYRRQRLKM